MAEFIKDGMTFFDGFFEKPVLSIEKDKIIECLEYLKQNKTCGVYLSPELEDFYFLDEINFVDELYLPRCNSTEYSPIYRLKNLKRMIVNIEGGEPNLNCSQIQSLEYLSIDWYSNFPSLEENTKLKELVVWKFRPKEKELSVLRLPKNLEKLEITESNIINLNGLYANLFKFEAHYCKQLNSLEGIQNLGENIKILIIENCAKLTDCTPITNCKYIEKIILGDSGHIPTIKWLKAMKNVKHFSFWGTRLDDGDTSPCFGIEYVNFKNNANYNHTLDEFK